MTKHVRGVSEIKMELRSDAVIIDHVKSKVEPTDGRTVDYVAPSNGMIKIHVRGIVSLIKKKERF